MFVEKFIMTEDMITTDDDDRGHLILWAVKLTKYEFTADDIDFV